MAFEGVFSNIDYGLPVRARQADADRLQRSIGQGMAQYNAQQDRELKRRQLEQEASEVDVEQLAQEGYMAIAAGGQPTLIQAQAMDVSFAMMRPQARLDQTGLPVISQPIDPRTRLGGLVEQPPAPRYDLPIGTKGIVPDQRKTIDGAQVMPMDQAQINAALSGGGVFPPSQPPPPISPAVSPEEFATAQAARDVAITGRGAETPLAIKEELGAKGGLQEYLGKKKIDSVFAGVKLGEKSLAQQKKYEDSLKIMLEGYRGLIEEGAAIQTLSKDSDWGDVFKNLSAAAASTGVGQGIAGASGTRAQAARESMNRTLPLMFGSLRTLLGLTGKELDTPKEKAFYMKALPSAGVSIGSNLDNIEELSNRFGNSETASTVQAVRDLLNGDGTSKGVWSIKRK